MKLHFRRLLAMTLVMIMVLSVMGTGWEDGESTPYTSTVTVADGKVLTADLSLPGTNTMNGDLEVTKNDEPGALLVYRHNKTSTYLVKGSVT